MTPPPMPEDVRDTDQLRLLAIFHYVAAGLGLLGLLFLVGHFFMMRTMLTIFEDLPKLKDETTGQVEPPPLVSYGNGSDESESQVKPSEQIPPREVSGIPPKFFGSLFDGLIVFYVFGAVFIVVKMILNLVSAQMIGKRKGRIYSMVVAGFNCLSFPLGTALGVFTFVVLSRTSVDASYRKAAAV